jgi:hypothetical protein
MSIKKEKTSSMKLPVGLENKHKKPLKAVIAAFVSGDLQTTQITKCLKRAREPKKDRKVNAYVIFSTQNRQKAIKTVEDSGKEVNLGSVSTELGKMWGELPEIVKDDLKAKAGKTYMPVKKAEKKASRKKILTDDEKKQRAIKAKEYRGDNKPLKKATPKKTMTKKAKLSSAEKPAKAQMANVTTDKKAKYRAMAVKAKAKATTKAANMLLELSKL